MGLTAEQRAARVGKLTASRIGVLMSGDKEGILRLYREFIGELEEENLDDNWPVQLGESTEKLNLDWYEKKNKRLLTKRGLVVTHPKYDWAAATIDGFDPELKCPIEAKHVGGREAMVVILNRYQPQCQWQMFVTETKLCGLSTIMGANEPVVDYIDRVQPYVDLMFERAQGFMYCVAMKTPPVKLDPIPVPVDADANIDMTGNNQWTHFAIEYMANHAASEKFEEAKKSLKAMVPENAKRCYGAGICIHRDRARRLHVREESM